MSHCRFIIGFVLLIVLLVLSTAAASGPAEYVIQLGVGQSAVLGDEGVSVGFAGVPTDTRCPLSVTCVWEGVAELSLWLRSKDGEEIHFTLHTTTTGGGNRWLEIAGHAIWLGSLDPYPNLPGAADIDPGEYVATLEITTLETVDGGKTSWGMMKGRYQ